MNQSVILSVRLNEGDDNMDQPFLRESEDESDYVSVQSELENKEDAVDVNKCSSVFDS